MKGPDVSLVLKKLKRLYPEAKTTLNWKTPLQLLVATILSAQCTDVRVNKTTPDLFKKYKKAGDYLKVPVSELQRDIRTCGTFRMKAKSIRGACRGIIERFGGKVPRKTEDMVTLPGVGRKTAAVVLSSAYGVLEGIAVDTHVERLSRRLKLTGQNDPKKIEKDLMRQTERRDWANLSNLLIAHGRKICVARKSRCQLCVFKYVCPASRILFPKCRK